MRVRIRIRSVVMVLTSVVTSLTLESTDSLCQASWSSLGSGTDALVEVLGVYDGKLVAGGWFTTINGKSANRIAIWDGVAWSPLGSGMNHQVHALAVYNGKLIAGGPFTFAGDSSANRIAAWDRSSWSPLGSGVDGTIHALCMFDGKLIAGGEFTIAGGVSANHIAAWDGTSWSALGKGTNDRVQCLTNFDGKLVAGGYFTMAGSVSAGKVATWDGNNWSTLGLGISGFSVDAVATYNGKLTVGGYFSVAGGLPANYIASWDGTSWSALGSGMGGSFPAVWALAEYNERLIAGGPFSTAGSAPASCIAAWDGSAWSALGLGLGGPGPCIPALTVYDQKLVAGGSFNTAGGIPAVNIAAWFEPAEVPTHTVSLDIKPGSCPNPLYGTDQTRGKAVLPTAILGTADFDVHDVNPESITLNGVSPLRWSYEDVSTPADKSNDSCACTEDGPDGFADLTLKFDRNAIEATLVNPPTKDGMLTAAATITPDEEWDVLLAGDGEKGPMSRERMILVVQGKLNDSTPVEGYDCVQFMSKGGATATRLDEAPGELLLGANHPNPFNPTTIIEYSLPSQTMVTIEIFNVLGQRVRTLVNETKPAGSHQAEWNGADDRGNPVSTGVYLYRFQAGEVVQTKKMLLIK